LIERKKRLAAIVPVAPAFVFYVDHVEANGRDLFASVCAKDLEGSSLSRNSPRMIQRGQSGSKSKIRTTANAKAGGKCSTRSRDITMLPMRVN
jgi:hypothetical protein